MGEPYNYTIDTKQVNPFLTFLQGLGAAQGIAHDAENQRWLREDRAYAIRKRIELEEQTRREYERLQGILPWFFGNELAFLNGDQLGYGTGMGLGGKRVSAVPTENPQLNMGALDEMKPDEAAFALGYGREGHIQLPEGGFKDTPQETRPPRRIGHRSGRQAPPMSSFDKLRKVAALEQLVGGFH